MVDVAVNTQVLGHDTNPVPTSGVIAPLLDGYSYSTTSVYGSNIVAAWAYATVCNKAIAAVDDGFDPATTSLHGNFNAALSTNFGTGGVSNIGEPSGDFHRATTSGLIGDDGRGGQPTGAAPNATIVDVKADVGSLSLSEYVNALTYTSAQAHVINDSWAADRIRYRGADQFHVRKLVLRNPEHVPPAIFCDPPESEDVTNGRPGHPRASGGHALTPIGKA